MFGVSFAGILLNFLDLYFLPLLPKLHVRSTILTFREIRSTVSEVMGVQS